MIMANIGVSCETVVTPNGMYSAINVGNISFVDFSPP